MSARSSSDREWARLREERAALRTRLATIAREVDARARDPFGLKSAMTRHPVAAAGIAAGAGAVLVSLLVRSRRGAADDEPPRSRRDDDRQSILDSALQAGVRAAVPWLVDLVAAKLTHRGDEGTGGDGQPARTGDGRSAVAEDFPPV